jgi:signal transduction histidine kinase
MSAAKYAEPRPTGRTALSPAALVGWRLSLARTAWLAAAALVVALFVAFVPLNWYGVRTDWLIQSGARAVARYVSFQTFAYYVLALRALIALVCFGVAGLIVWRKSDSGLALLVSVGLMLLPIEFVSVDGSGHVYPFYPAPWQGVVQAARDWVAFFGIHYLVYLCFLFPDGRFAPGWMKWAALGVLVSLGLVLGYTYGYTSWAVWFTTFSAWLLLAAGSQVYRYLKLSGAVERQQIKWFVAAVVFGPLWMLVGLFGLGPGLTDNQTNLLGMHLQYAWALFLPLGVGVSVLRRGLWGVDPLLNRALVYAALTLLVLTLYGAIVFGLGAVIGASGNVGLAVLATGLVAILFNPLRHRLQRGVNRLMYGERDDPATVLARLGQRLETAIAPEATLTSIVETVAQTLKVPYVSIELADGNQRVRAVAFPSSVPPPAGTAAFPLTYQAEVLGHLRVAPRAPGEPLSAADRRLLAQVARQAAPAVRAYRLTADLHRSRERLIVAREAERRRLRRDLHDGLGPTLASQAFKLDAALELFDSDPATARQLLDEVKAQTQATVADIRRLVYELRPPALDELGLAGALQAHVQSLPPVNGLRVTVDVPPDLPPLSAAVEVAAYRIALEALTNVLRHAQARTCQLQLSVEGGRLQLSVTDDGVGLQHPVPDGLGLISMRERADELGGACRVERPANGGTRVYAELPTGPADDG